MNYLGIGQLGSNVIINRKFRHTFEVMSGNEDILPACYVKMNSRPAMTQEVTEINYLSETTWIPGRLSREKIVFTYWDVSNDNKVLYEGLARIYKLSEDGVVAQRLLPLTGEIRTYDGCGTLIESWELKDVIIESINFGELDFSSSECTTIELTVSYGEVTYRSHLAPFGEEVTYKPDVSQTEPELGTPVSTDILIDILLQ